MSSNHVVTVLAFVMVAPVTAQIVPEISDPIPIHAPGTFAKYRTDSLDVACDSRGICVVIGSAHVSGSRDDNIWVSRSGDGGRTWSDPVVFWDEFQESDILPQIATDGERRWLAWWMGSSAISWMIRSEDDGLTWTQPERFVLGRSAPRLSADASGVWAAVWQADVEIGRVGPEGSEAVYATDIRFSRSFDHGRTWSEPVSLNLRTGTEPDREDQSPYVLSGGGVFLTAWSSIDPLGGTIGSGHDILFRRSTDGGGEWSDVQALNINAGSPAEGDGYDELPRLATDGAGRWIAAWKSSAPNSGYYLARSSDNGATWSEPADFAGIHDLAADSCGNWLATWWTAGEAPIATDTKDGSPPPPPVRERIDGEIIITYSQDAGLTWTTPSVLNSDAESEIDDDLIPRLAAFGDGKWIAVWIREDEGLNHGSDVNKVMAARFEFPSCVDAGDEQTGVSTGSSDEAGQGDEQHGMSTSSSDEAGQGDEQNGSSTGSSDETAQTAACPAVAALLVAVAFLGMRVSSKGSRWAR